MKTNMIISDIILKKESKFTINEIIEETYPLICNYFDKKEEYIKYLKNKLNDMCYYGLIGKTNLYYFSI